MERAVAFDVMGTLFDLRPLQERFRGLGAPEGALQAWFAKLLHSAAALTLAGEFRPFGELAEAALRVVLAEFELDVGRAGEVLEGLSRLPPYPDAGEAVERLTGAGVRVMALTNGSEENTLKLLERAGLADAIPLVVTTEQVGVYKPHPDVYRRACEELRLPAERVTLIAAHGWDVVGAVAAGLRGVWVDRVERIWPLPVPEVQRAPDLRAAAELVIGGRD